MWDSWCGIGCLVTSTSCGPSSLVSYYCKFLVQPCKISTMSYFTFVDQLPQLAFTGPHSSTDSIQLFLPWPQHRHILSLYINFKLVFVKLSGLLLNMDGFWEGLDLTADSWEVGCSKGQATSSYSFMYSRRQEVITCVLKRHRKQTEHHIHIQS